MAKALTTLGHLLYSHDILFQVWWRLVEIWRRSLQKQSMIFSLSLRYTGVHKSGKNLDRTTLKQISAWPGYSQYTSSKSYHVSWRSSRIAGDFPERRNVHYVYYNKITLQLMHTHVMCCMKWVLIHCAIAAYSAGFQGKWSHLNTAYELNVIKWLSVLYSMQTVLHLICIFLMYTIAALTIFIV